MREIRCCHACDIVVKAHNNFVQTAVIGSMHVCVLDTNISVYIVCSHLYFWNIIIYYILYLPYFFLLNDYSILKVQFKVENLTLSSIGRYILFVYYHAMD